MKLSYIYILLLFIFHNAFSQEAKKDSIIYLKEVISGEKSKEEIIKIKTKGEELASTFEGGIKSRICLVEDIPAGNLKTVKLYFNNGLINLAKKSLNVKYEDTELKLVMYVDKDGKPGNLLVAEDMRFTVKKSHKGALELDLSALNIKAPEKFFIGIELVKETAEYTPIVLKIVANSKGSSFDKSIKDKEWRENPLFPQQIKMELKIAAQ